MIVSKNNSLSIIVPVYNEEKTIPVILRRLNSFAACGWKKQIIIIDNCSTDGSLKKIKHFITRRPKNFKLVEVSGTNSGKGVAIQIGIKNARGTATIVQDADLEYNPADIAKLIREYEAGESRVIFGKRNKSSIINNGFYIFGGNVLTFFVNIFYGVRLADAYTCYKLINTKLLKELDLKSRGFEIDMELIAKLLNRQELITEVPISYNPRTTKEGKKIRVWDGYKALKVLFLCFVGRL